MKQKWNLFASIFQLVVGLAAIVAYVILAIGGEPLGRLTGALIVAICMLIIGSIDIVDWIKENRKSKDIIYTNEEKENDT